MNTYHITLLSLVALAALIWFLKARSKATGERWWQCAWCGCYFNEGKDVSNVPPTVPIKSHGCCASCKANTLKEYQMTKVLGGVK